MKLQKTSITLEWRQTHGLEEEAKLRAEIYEKCLWKKEGK